MDCEIVFMKLDADFVMLLMITIEFKKSCFNLSLSVEFIYMPVRKLKRWFFSNNCFNPWHFAKSIPRMASAR